jgi:dTMP kinase
MELILIAAYAKNRVVGEAGKLPWHISADLKRFKDLTSGNAVIMGKVTYDSIIGYLGKPLPNRTTILLYPTDIQNLPENVIQAKSIDEAVEKAKDFEKVFIAGGASVFKQFIESGKVDGYELTEIKKDFSGDSYLQDIDFSNYKQVSRIPMQEKDIKFDFVTYKRKKGKFIVFEGIDGSGKSTQMKLISDYLFSKDKHNHIVMTREPYKDIKIRSILKNDTNPIKNSEIIADLFIKDRKIHVSELIKPNTDKGTIVISDRYKLSTIAYQSSQGLSMQALIDNHKGLPVPDITFIIDVPSEEASKRIKKEEGRDEHKFESNIDFLEKVRQKFLEAKSKINENIYVINGSREIDDIFNDIKEIIDTELQ